MNGQGRALLFFATTMATTLATTLASCGGSDDDAPAAVNVVEQGKQIFRFDTFGDEAQWTDTLRMHEVISAVVDSGPIDSCRDEPSSAYRTRGASTAHRPATGGRPARLEYAMTCGTRSAATVRAAMRAPRSHARRYSSNG